MNRRQFLQTTAAATLAGPALVLAEPPPGGAARIDLCSDFADAAFHVATTAAEMIAGRLKPEGRVAVFAPGDADGRMTVHIHEAARILQGELIYHLINKARGRYFVLDKASLGQAFTRAGVKPDAVDRSDPKATAAALGKLRLDAAILGTIDATKDRAGDGRAVPTTLSILFADGGSRQLTERVESDAVPTIKSTVHYRVRTELWLTPPGRPPRPVPIVTDRRPGSEYAGVLYAVLPDDLPLGGDGARYFVRLKNTGVATVPAMLAAGETYAQKDAAREARRLFTVALAIDGVNSIYQDRGDGQAGPVMLAPRNARRWIVAGPGLLLIKSGPRPTDFRLDPAPGGSPGHGQLDIRGFQADGNTALAFTLAPPGESIAEAAGVSGEVGVITVAVKRQKLRGDEDIRPPRGPDDAITGGAMPGGPAFGTKAGAPLRSQVSRFQVDTYDEERTVRIFYRPERDVPIPPAERVDPWARS